MERRVEPRLPRGMRDILPAQMILRQYVIGTIQEVFERFGFEPLQTPAIELSEIFTGKYGEDAEHLIYRLARQADKGPELVLRYDLTVPLCRVIAQYPELVKPFKRYQIAPVWRGERPQKGRYREFYQCDADTIGTSSVMADAEMLNIIYEVLTRLGFKSFVININNRKVLGGIGRLSGVPEEVLPVLYRSIDKLDKIGEEGVRHELGALDAARMPDETVDRLLGLLNIRCGTEEMVARLGKDLEAYPEAAEGVAELREIVGCLRGLGIPEDCYRIVPSMVRGLGYYTGPIFETVVKEPKIGSITGGGRYDRLVGMFTQRSYPATGTTIGIERIIDVMEEMKMFPPEVGPTVTKVLVTRFSPDMVEASLKCATSLRRAGINTEAYFESDPLGDQIRYALKKGIRFVAVVGPDEAAAGKVTIKNLAAGKQETLALDDAVARLCRWDMP
ncbi:MAG: histidine--tRNA ligase [bacterium]